MRIGIHCRMTNGIQSSLCHMIRTPVQSSGRRTSSRAILLQENLSHTMLVSDQSSSLLSRPLRDDRLLNSRFDPVRALDALLD